MVCSVNKRLFICYVIRNDIRSGFEPTSEKFLRVIARPVELRFANPIKQRTNQTSAANEP
jgi:hypothetical protein